MIAEAVQDLGVALAVAGSSATIARARVAEIAVPASERATRFLVDTRLSNGDWSQDGPTGVTN